MTTKKQQYEDILKQEAVLAKLFREECYVCHRKYRARRGFTFHHKYYNPGEKTYKDFNSNQLEYKRYLFPIIRAHPKQFALLCQPHHHAVEQLKRFGKDTFRRLIKLARESRND